MTQGRPAPNSPGNRRKVVAEIERIRSLTLPERHMVTPADVDPKRLHRTLTSTYDR